MRHCVGDWNNDDLTREYNQYGNSPKIDFGLWITVVYSKWQTGRLYAILQIPNKSYKLNFLYTRC